MDGWIDEWDGWMDEWDGWIDEWMVACMIGWRDK
jgi:hypothetical protein